MSMTEAVAILRAQGLIGFPTETFYGIGGDALNPLVVAKVFQAKARLPDRPVALVVADRASVTELVEAIPPAAERLMHRCWPGPLTIVLRASSKVPAALTAGTGTIGIRVPAHPVARALLARFGGPLTATSANRSGSPSPTDAGDVVRSLGTALDLVLDAGPTPGGLHSTVVDMTGSRPRLVRAGAVPFSEG